jgi:hypothetical protein
MMLRLPIQYGRVIALGLVAAMVFQPANAATPIDWDRVENVRQAAAKLGEIQARQGADQAFRFITACYKTHGLASAYSRAFESCIAQDFMLTQALALIYERIDPAKLKTMGAPTRELLQQSLNQRVSGAYANYEMAPSEGLTLKAIVDEHGLPIFMKAVFPAKGGGAGAPAVP